MSMRFRHRSSASAEGFTLIELMVVIAIIGILAAILVPGLSGPKKVADDLALKAQGGLIRKGMATAAADNDGHYPVPTDWDEVVTNTAMYTGQHLARVGTSDQEFDWVGMWCYIQDPITGTIYIYPCLPGVPGLWEYHLEFDILNDPDDRKLVVDSLAGVDLVASTSVFPPPTP